MSRLCVPSLQHMARVWHASPKKVEDELVKIALRPPFFNYNTLHLVARECLLHGIPEEQLVEGIKRKEKRKKIQDILLEVVPLITKHFGDVQPDFVHAVAQQFYPLDRGLRVPFKPEFIYGLGGEVFLPWFIFWKRNPVNDKRLSLFVTLAMEIMRQDPDIEEAKLHILDFSAKKGGIERRLDIINAEDVPLLAKTEAEKMLEVFVEGFLRAERALAKIQPVVGKPEDGVFIDPDQLSLWGK